MRAALLALLAATGLAAAVASPFGAHIVTISHEECPNVARSREPRPDQIMQGDACTMCQQLYRNRWRWDWRKAPTSLLTGFAAHQQEQAKWMACALMQCTEFSSGVCDVPKHAEGSETLRVSPCPSRFVCFSCLPKFINRQQLGCLDSVFDVI